MMVGVLALGVSAQWARAGPADFTPLVAMVGMVLVVRFVLRIPLTPMTLMLAFLAGASWAVAIAQWGFTVPTLAATIGIMGVSIAQHRARSR